MNTTILVSVLENLNQMSLLTTDDDQLVNLTITLYYDTVTGCC